MNKLHFTRGCGDSWRDLCDALGIQPYERARFPQGHEPAEIWEWLESRGRLADLPRVLTQVGREDLSADLAPALPASRPPAPPGLDRRRRRALMLGLPAVVLVIVASLTAVSLWSSRSRGASAVSSPGPSASATPSLSPSASAAPSPSPSASVPGKTASSSRPPTPTAAAGVAALKGKWAGTLHCDPRYCTDYPIEVTLSPGATAEVVGKSRYTTKNCAGSLKSSATTTHGVMLTEDINEPPGECAKRPMYLTARVTEPDKLEIKYWWTAQLSPSSEWYAEATLTRSR